RAARARGRRPLARGGGEDALRLSPRGWGIGRRPAGPDSVCGYDIPAGALVNLSPWVTHRHPGLWPDPERFDPERFRPGRDRDRARFAYFPFSGGPRLCIGEPFALLEAQLIVAMTLQRFALTLADARPVQIEPTLPL